MQTRLTTVLLTALCFPLTGCDVPPTADDDFGQSSQSGTQAAPQTPPPTAEEAPDTPSTPNSIPPDWKPLAIHGFTMWMPPNYKYIERRSPDSFLGVIESEGVFLVFDYGWYSDLRKANRHQPDKKETTFTLDGEAAYLWRYADDADEPYLMDLPKRAAMHQVWLLNIPKIGDTENGLWVRARFRKDLPEKERELERVLRSVTFHSD